MRLTAQGRRQLSPVNIARIFGQQDQNGEGGKNYADEKPEPATATGVLCPERTKGPGEKNRSGRNSPCSAPECGYFALEGRNASFDGVVLLCRL